MESVILISIVIPAHNRPAFLLEAINSIAVQTYSNFEVIVIDDGSVPCILLSELETVLGQRVTLYRNDFALGVPKAKNAGVNAAKGEITLILDDDDLLMPNTLERIFWAFSNYPNIDCLFLRVQPFGPYADSVAESSNFSLCDVINKSNPEEQDKLYFFSGNLFDALITSVPIDFQRPAARRGFWNITGGFDEKCLYSESAWAIHASCIGTLALTEEPATQWRIHDNNFGWPPNLNLDQIRQRQMNNEIAATQQLLRTFKSQKEAWKVRIKKMELNFSDQLFSKAYYLRDKNRYEGIRALLGSFILQPKAKHLKLTISYLFPLQWIKSLFYKEKTNKTKIE